MCIIACMHCDMYSEIISVGVQLLSVLTHVQLLMDLYLSSHPLKVSFLLIGAFQQTSYNAAIYNIQEVFSCVATQLISIFTVK